MLLLGLLFVAATGAFTGLLIADNMSGGPDYTVTMLGNNLATMNSLQVFLAGVALALVFCLGLAMLAAGSSMRRRRRAILLTERREAAEARSERDAMAARLDAEQGQEGEPAMPSTMPDDTDTATPTQPRRRHRHVFGH